jgi:formylmethanofuran dehydrogenase subunit E
MKPITRRALAATAAVAALRGHDDDAIPALDRSTMIHGAAEPFAVAGYRMGEAALTALNLGRASEDLEVVHYSPRQRQFSSIVDGLQAATGASLGQWNLSLIEAKAGPTASVVRNKRTGQSVRLTLLPAFVKEYAGLPAAARAAAASRLTGIPQQQIFTLIRIG